MALAILIYFIAMSGLAIVLNVASIGKPRSPLSPVTAAWIVSFGVLNLAGYAYLFTQV